MLFIALICTLTYFTGCCMNLSVRMAIGSICWCFVLCLQRYKSQGHDTIILAGEEYGSGSSRDWAAKGPMLQVLHLIGSHYCQTVHPHCRWGFSITTNVVKTRAMLQGVKAVIAKSFERIHRSNLVGMGIVPLCFKPGEDADTLGLTGHERYTIHLPDNVTNIKPGQDVTVTTDTGKSFTCIVRFDTEV